MNRFLLASLAAVAAWAGAASVDAATVFQKSLLVNRSENIFSTNQFDVKLVLGDSFSTPSNPLTAFSASVSPNVQPFTIKLTKGVDAAFDAVAARITDGKDDFVRLMFTERATGRAELRGWFESLFFLNAGLPNSPDLSGLSLDGVELTIESFTLSPPGSAGIGAAAASTSPAVDLRMTFSVTGIPEPHSVALAGAAISLFAVARAKKLRRRSSLG